MDWHLDPIFQDGTDERVNLETSSSPAFRLSMILPVYKIDPRSYFPVLSDIFDCFKPALQEHAERLLMVDVPDGSPRRRKSILEEDWEPFEHLEKKLPDDYADFTGFFFQSGHVPYGLERSQHIFDKGPTGFSYYSRGNIEVDAAISVEDWEAGILDIERLKEALLKLENGSAVAGFGLQRSMDVNNPQNDQKLFAVAKKYPNLNIQKAYKRGWLIGSEKSLKDVWIFGINWITVVSEPFLSALEKESRFKDLPSPDFDCTRSDSCALFQVGEAPVASANPDLLARYRSLGNVLKPIGKGSPSKKRPGHPVFKKKKPSLKWERRFYDGEWFEEFGA